jgi:hypothetical protein
MRLARVPHDVFAHGVPVACWPETVRRRWFIGGLYGVVFALLAVPIFSVTVPPLVDYPNHLARMHILAAYATSPELQANYVVAWKIAPYLAMDLIIPLLARFMSIYTAGQVFLYDCLLQFVIGTAAIHAALYRRLSPWPVASALFAYSFVVSYGFVNYVFGVGVWLLAFAGWIVLSRGLARWRILTGSVLSLAVFFSHYFAFFGYMLCVGAYEFGVWLSGRQRTVASLLGRGFVAFCPFGMPLAIFVAASQGQEGGVTLYATAYGWMIAMLSPLVFLGAPFNAVVLAVALIIPARRGLLGRMRVPPAMWGPLIALGVAAIAMPNALFGVWGVDYRLPIVFVFLAIAACSWRTVPGRVEALLACGMVTVLTVNMAEIVYVWRPIGRQFDEFRAALAVIPPGARVIAFRDTDGIDPALSHEPAALYDHLATLAIVERDAYVPFLFKHKMMPVEAAPALRPYGTAIGQTIGLRDMIDGADPVKGPAMLGTPSTMGMHNYWGDWPRHYDYAIELSFGARPALPTGLERVRPGGFFNIYRIGHQGQR